MKFANNKRKKTAAINSTRTLQTEKWVLFTTYLGKRIVMVRLGKVLLEFEVDWMTAEILNGTSKGINISGVKNLEAELVGIWD